MILIRTLICIFIAAILVPIDAVAQKNIIELSPSLQKRSPAFFSDSIHSTDFIVDTKAILPGAPSARQFDIRSMGEGIYILRSTPFDLMQWARKLNGWIYVDEQLKPKTEAGVINYDMAVNRINRMWGIFPGMDGSGETVSVKENRMDTMDLDLLGRNKASDYASPVQENHATIMTTLIAGSGNSSYRGKGVAYNSFYSSSDFIKVLPDTPVYYSSAGIQVQNHSYGTAIQNFYGVNARAFDLSANKDSSLLHVFSSGNSGTSTSGQGVYANVKGMANITGNVKMAKNIMVVGAMTGDNAVPAYSSRGPLYDGRLAPQLVAFGDDGTSGAAAIVSGTSVILQQQYKKLFNRPASSALIRALLINSARDIGTAGPDYSAGYGALDAAAAMQALISGQYLCGTVNSSASSQFDIDVPANISSFKVTLAWNDTAAVSGATKALINDLDLVVVNKQTGESFLPWGLSVYPDADSLRAPARRMADSLNTAEQVGISSPPAGTYTIRVTAKSLVNPRIPFSVVYQFDTAGVFRWDYPLRNDLVVAGDTLKGRWSSTMPLGTKGRIEISRNKGQSWQWIDDNADIGRGYYSLKMPDSILELRLKMTAGAAVFETDDFMVSPSLVTKFGYVCDTAVLAFWNGVSGADNYQVYRLQDNAMQRLQQTKDTATSVPRTGSPYIAIAPMVRGREGIKGIAVNFDNQGVGCYINNFIASASGTNAAVIQLTLGTLYQVKRVEIIKVSANNKLLLGADDPKQKIIDATDPALSQGMNLYQAKVILSNGAEILSQVETVYYLNDKGYIVFPNPSFAGAPVYLLSENVDEEAGDIYDMQGRRVTGFVINEKIQKMPVETLRKGSYVLRISSNGKTVRLISFVIL